MRIFAKQILFTLAALLIAPVTIVYLTLSQVVSKNFLITGFSQALSLLPGKTGNYLRAGFYRFALTHCSPDATISFGTLFSQQDTEIEAGVYIGPQCNIGKCKIGANTLIGSGVHIMSGKGQHNFDDLSTPIKDQGGQLEKVEIGANCWLGNCALVMANIAEDSVIGAGSVVVHNLPKLSIAAGNPAKVIQVRKPSEPG